MSSAGIDSAGVGELARAVQRLADGTPDMVRVLVARSGDLVVDWARPRVPHRSGAAASSLRVEDNGQSATVTSGGARAPYYPWLDWGGRVGRAHATLRPYTNQGRYLYPGLRAQSDAITDAQVAAMRDLVTAAGLTIT